jgi:hypothetical protein
VLWIAAWLGDRGFPDQIVSVFTNPDLLVVAGFCIIGLLASVVAILTVPDLAEFANALQQLVLSSSTIW